MKKLIALFCFVIACFFQTLFCAKEHNVELLGTKTFKGDKYSYLKKIFFFPSNKGYIFSYHNYDYNEGEADYWFEILDNNFKCRSVAYPDYDVDSIFFDSSSGFKVISELQGHHIIESSWNYNWQNTRLEKICENERKILCKKEDVTGWQKQWDSTLRVLLFGELRNRSALFKDEGLSDHKYLHLGSHIGTIKDNNNTVVPPSCFSLHSKLPFFIKQEVNGSFKGVHVYRIDDKEKKIRRIKSLNTNSVMSVAWHSKHPIVAIGDWQGTISLWQIHEDDDVTFIKRIKNKRKWNCFYLTWNLNNLYSCYGGGLNDGSGQSGVEMSMFKCHFIDEFETEKELCDLLVGIKIE